MKSWIKIIISIICVLVADLVTKHFLFHIEYFNLIPNIISISGNVENTGAAWGMFSGKTFWLVLVSVAIIVALFVFNHFIKSKNTLYCLSFGFIIGGAIGNLVDRIWLNYVRDFIFFDFWPTFPVFNVADIFLCVGAVMMAIFVLFIQGKKSEK